MTSSAVLAARNTTPLAATAALALCIGFVGLVAALHLVRFDLPPQAHVLSEYALGPTGWIMASAFFALAGSFAALLLALRRSLTGWRGTLGMIALALAAIGAAMGGLFPMDPVGTPPAQATPSAQLHNLAFMLGGPGALLAITFVNWCLARQASWRAARSMLAATTAFAWLAMVVFFIAVSMLMSNPQGGDMAIGLWNRLLVLSWVVWMALLAARSRRR
jgi:Protein of unknown function (DUF998)